MKKAILILMFLMLTSLGFGSIGRENVKNSFNVNVPSCSVVGISSYTVITSSYTNELKGVQRVFHNESSSVRIKYQIGGSTTTILTSGTYIEPLLYYVEDVYMGNMYFQLMAGESSVNMSINTLERK